MADLQRLAFPRPPRRPILPRVRPSLIQRVRRHLAALMVGLLVLVSIDPCAAFAAPSPSHPVAQAPADPCGAHHPGIVCACAQLSCQHAAIPPSDPAERVPMTSHAQFILAADTVRGRVDAPPLPPPRLL
jgi:hypothetical protein